MMLSVTPTGQACGAFVEGADLPRELSEETVASIREIYRHKWEPGMLVMWDNRSVLHRATGGYEGYDRLLHRTTIGATVQKDATQVARHPMDSFRRPEHRPPQSRSPSRFRP